MVRILVLYNKPGDVQAFERHYREVHLPLAKTLPGLQRYTISRNLVPANESEPYYLVAELDLGRYGRIARDISITRRTGNRTGYCESSCPIEPGHMQHDLRSGRGSVNFLKAYASDRRTALRPINFIVRVRGAIGSLFAGSLSVSNRPLSY